MSRRSAIISGELLISAFAVIVATCALFAQVAFSSTDTTRAFERLADEAAIAQLGTCTDYRDEVLALADRGLAVEEIESVLNLEQVGFGTGNIESALARKSRRCGAVSDIVRISSAAATPGV